MGEMTDMILEGVLCEQCGVYIGEACEHPRLCGACEEEETIKCTSIHPTH